jgi:hypothetical protein
MRVGDRLQVIGDAGSALLCRCSGIGRDSLHLVNDGRYDPAVKDRVGDTHQRPAGLPLAQVLEHSVRTATAQIGMTARTLGRCPVF